MATREERIGLTLTYYVTEEVPSEGTYGNQPKRPEHTDELEIDVHYDDDSPGIPDALRSKDLQVQLLGTPRAMEELGRYLIALARMQSENPYPHDHFEDLGSANGGRMHLIVERQPPR